MPERKAARKSRRSWTCCPPTGLSGLRRIKPDRQRALSFSAELLLIEALKTLEPPDLPLDIYTLEGGKPALRHGPCFSLSHSGDLVFCAVSDAPVGADVEKLPDKEPGCGLLERCLSEKERELCLESENKKELFTLLWSLKESYAKMDGAGLGRLHLREISLELGPEGRAGVRARTQSSVIICMGDTCSPCALRAVPIPRNFYSLN